MSATRTSDLILIAAENELGADVFNDPGSTTDKFASMHGSRRITLKLLHLAWHDSESDRQSAIACLLTKLLTLLNKVRSDNVASDL
jgi:hypothetical protein